MTKDNAHRTKDKGQRTKDKRQKTKHKHKHKHKYPLSSSNPPPHALVCDSAIADWLNCAIAEAAIGRRRRRAADDTADEEKYVAITDSSVFSTLHSHIRQSSSEGLGQSDSEELGQAVGGAQVIFAPVVHHDRVSLVTIDTREGGKIYWADSKRQSYEDWLTDGVQTRRRRTESQQRSAVERVVNAIWSICRSGQAVPTEYEERQLQQAQQSGDAALDILMAIGTFPIH